jgi:hypothetical protein
MPFVTVSSSRSSVIARSSGGKVDIKKQGLNSVKNSIVRNNLMGLSDKMKDKNWVDASGRKGAILAPACAVHIRLVCCFDAEERKPSHTLLETARLGARGSSISVSRLCTTLLYAIDNSSTCTR